MRRLFPTFALVALAVIVFAGWMHLGVLDPRNVGWVIDGHDRGQSAIGLAAYLRAAGSWPLLHQPLIGAPDGMALLFTDSIPLLGLLLGPVAPWLPPGLQFVGPWYLACMLLQAGFGWAIVRRHAPDGVSAWLGAALLVLMPVLINRYGHASLCAQWLILWALWLHLDPVRARRPLWWIALLGVAALVHSYLLLMVAAIWASSVLRSLVAEPERGRTLIHAAIVAIATALIVSLHGILGQHFGSTGTYGRFPMPIDALWNPGNPTYSALLPSSPESGRGFEGFQYLGAGLLALALAALVRLAFGLRHGADAEALPRDALRRLAWLVPAFLIFAVVAIGPQPLFAGQPVGGVRLPPAIIDLLDPVRASGRLFWPVTYTIAIAAILIMCRMKRAPLILAGALALQLVDLMPMLAAVRATSVLADTPGTYHRTPDPRWDALIARAGAVDFQPPDPFGDLVVMEEIAWRAVRQCRPVPFFYASRETVATRRRLDAAARRFRAGLIDPARLYVLVDGAVPPALAHRVRHLDGIAIIPPSAAARPRGKDLCPTK
ncbi:DUF6311 domain-containing protein [Sphingomonas sp. So64.6b]|uniref:DUF6311 domain-containing protein n=1 Tax=Sphingomonas sp. So64.6b TaxID=2997354 RepID=UPI001FCF06D3|nr:DUF6311 domain-containing protein [Sphingomonas sp. So64.6b]